jgi:SAM-dependent methyltransferase
MKPKGIETKDYLVSGKTFKVVPSSRPGILQTKPAPRNLEAYYESDRYISHTDGKKDFFEGLYQLAKSWNLSRKVKMIGRLHQGVGTLLDVGAGTGDFLLSARSSGWKVSGIEPNIKARGLAATKGLNLSADLAELDNGTVDCITLWHVLEHIPEPSTLLDELYKKLDANGHLILALPNYRSFDADHYGAHWAAYDVPRHLWHFSNRGITAFLAERGFERMETRPMPLDAFYVSWLSERYRKNPLAPISAFAIGLWSNLRAIRSGEYSSLVYVFKKKAKTAQLRPNKPL